MSECEVEEGSFFRELTRGHGPKALRIGGTVVRAAYRGGHGRRLLVIFHSSSPAHSKNRPRYESFLPTDLHQISISDPTLEGRDHLTAGWYLGGPREDVPGKLHRLVRNFAESLGCPERIYLGGSSGGFAALLYSSMDPTSLAIAACPQVDLDTYGSTNVHRLLESLYPEREANASVKSVTGINLLERYSGDFLNSAILLVSPGDYHHLFGQVAPLLAGVDPRRRSQLILDCRYHGIAKHGGSIPPGEYMSWVQAATASRTLLAAEVMEVRHQMAREGRDPRAPGAGRPHRAPPAPEDIRMAKLLRDHHLREDQGG